MATELPNLCSNELQKPAQVKPSRSLAVVWLLFSYSTKTLKVYYVLLPALHVIPESAAFSRIEDLAGFCLCPTLCFMATELPNLCSNELLKARSNVVAASSFIRTIQTNTDYRIQ
jgi:hypothetical protein